MKRPYNDRWERTRRYLLRNLFDNHGDLSPIPEEPRSDSSEDRSSPLPELVVEREPDRHDHGEEFYRRLEVRMRRYYRRLFVDGVSVHEAGLYDEDDISSEFEVNKSMASTFIIDTNNRIAEIRHTVTSDESMVNEDEREVSKNLEERSDTDDVMGISDDKRGHNDIQEPSRSDVTNEDQSEVNGTVNKTTEAQISDKASKSTESDLAQSCHVTYTTVAQVHGEQREKAPRVFEDGSPVLMPKAHELSRRVFGKAKNILNAINDVNEEDCKEDYTEEEEQAQDTDLEVDWLMKSTNSTSNQGSIESCEEEETYKVLEQNQASDSTGIELVVFDDQDLKATADENESPLRTSESDGESHLHSEESIGPNEFDHVELARTDRHSEIHEEEILEPVGSLEMAIRKGLFESKNARKTEVTSSDEELEDESNDRDEFEPVEVMRGTMQTRLTETLRRESTVSKDSPLAVKFATKATAENLEEGDPDHDDYRIDVSDVVMTETRAEVEDRSLARELATSQDSSVRDESGNDSEKLSFSDDFKCATDVFVDGDHETSKDTEANTPSVTKIRSIADVCEDIWSVSPVQINFEELSPKDHDVRTPGCGMNQKKRVSDSAVNVNTAMYKKKKYNNIAIQTGTSKEAASNWDSIKTTFFVGKPLVYRLCNCHDHVCPVADLQS